MTALRGEPMQWLLTAVESDTDACLFWPYSRTTKGYGRLRNQGRVERASRLVLTLTVGPPSRPDLVACHSCDNPPCCNPRHLRWDTPAGNSAEMTFRGRGHGRLTPADVRAAAERVRCGESKTAVATSFGVTRQALSYRLSGVSA